MNNQYDSINNNKRELSEENQDITEQNNIFIPLQVENYLNVINKIFYNILKNIVK